MHKTKLWINCINGGGGGYKEIKIQKIAPSKRTFVCPMYIMCLSACVCVRVCVWYVRRTRAQTCGVRRIDVCGIKFRIKFKRSHNALASGNANLRVCAKNKYLYNFVKRATGHAGLHGKFVGIEIRLIPLSNFCLCIWNLFSRVANHYHLLLHLIAMSVHSLRLP